MVASRRADLYAGGDVSWVAGKQWSHQMIEQFPTASGQDQSDDAKVGKLGKLYR